MGVPAHLAGLRRTAAGPFALEEAVSLVDAERLGREDPTALAARVLPVEEGLRGWPSVRLSAEEALRLDKMTPHLDKKLPDPVRKRLETELPRWSRKKAPAIGSPAAPKGP